MSEYDRRLDFNLRGAWRKGLEFPSAREAEIREAAAGLALAAGAKARIMRIRADGAVVVRAWWDEQDGWRGPGRAG